MVEKSLINKDERGRDQLTFTEKKKTSKEQNLERHEPLLARVGEDRSAFFPHMPDVSQPRRKPRNDIEHSVVR